jgi:hypothetical protein
VEHTHTPDRQRNGRAQPAPPPTTQPDRAQASELVNKPTPLTTEAEGGLTSEDEQIKEQARTSRTPEENTNLLEETPARSAAT